MKHVDVPISMDISHTYTHQIELGRVGGALRDSFGTGNSTSEKRRSPGTSITQRLPAVTGRISTKSPLAACCVEALSGEAEGYPLTQAKRRNDGALHSGRRWYLWLRQSQARPATGGR